MSVYPLTTNIQRFSLDDGPGIRTTLFLKGCPLHCPWCHNPETQSQEVEIYYHEAKCVRCGLCAEVCPEKAITPPGPNGEAPQRDREACSRCMECVKACQYQALTKVGEEMPMEDILREVLSDMPFYKSSGGGVTISGGEPLLFCDFVVELALRLRKEDCHVAVETSGFGKWEDLYRLSEHIDLFLYDVKHIDDSKHKEEIGVPVAPVLDNLRRLSERKTNIRVRIPVIPGFNMDKDCFGKIGDFLLGLDPPPEAVDLLPYHGFAEGKYEQLDRPYKYVGLESLERDDVLELEDILKTKGLSTTVGGTVGVGKR